VPVASIAALQARRADIECFARDLEARGRAQATITRRLCTVAGFYRYTAEEDLLEHSPAVHVRRPRLDYESHATGLDRNELGALPALNGLRVSEAVGADTDALGVERGHRTLVVIRKGRKVVTVPLAPRTARHSIWPSPPRTLTRVHQVGPAPRSTGMQPTSCPHTSPAPPVS
jgi:integrase/recombinase XerD